MRIMYWSIFTVVTPAYLLMLSYSPKEKMEQANEVKEATSSSNFRKKSYRILAKLTSTRLICKMQCYLLKKHSLICLKKQPNSL